MPMQTFLRIFYVSGAAGKLRLHKTIAAPTQNLAEKHMSRLLTSHNGYKVGTEVQLDSNEYIEGPDTEHGECGDPQCCTPNLMNPDSVEVWIGTKRQVYDTGRTMEAKYKANKARIEAEQDEERREVEALLVTHADDPEMVDSLLHDLDVINA